MSIRGLEAISQQGAQVKQRASDNNKVSTLLTQCLLAAA